MAEVLPADLVTELRQMAATGYAGCAIWAEAADEIERLRADCQELMTERDVLTQKVCELITQRQKAEHERDCAVEDLARAAQALLRHACVCGCPHLEITAHREDCQYRLAFEPRQVTRTKEL